MDTQSGTLQTLARHLVLALAPLKGAVADLPAFRAFLYRLGWDVRSLPPEYTALAAKIDAALAALDGLGDDPQPAEVLGVLNKVKAVYTTLRGVTNAPAGVDPALFFAEIGQGLFDLLLVDYLIEVFPSLHSALEALDVISQRYVEETDSRPGVLISHFQWDAIRRVLTDPGSIPTQVYGWGTNDLDLHRLAAHLLEFFIALNSPAYIGRVDRELGRGFKDSPDDPATFIDWGLKIPVLLDNIGGKEIEVGLALLELPAQGAKPAGLILQPLVPPEIGTSFDLSNDLNLELRGSSNGSSTLGVLLRPGDISVKFPFQEGTALPDAGVGLTLRYAQESPALLLGTPGKSRLELKGVATSFNLDFSEAQLELRLEAAPDDMKLVIAAADLDSFLGVLLGGHDMTVPLPLTVRWSNKTGIGFAGGTGFQVSLPGNQRLGALTLQQIQFALSTTRTSGQPPDLILEAGASLGGEIGPVAVSVDNVGLRLLIRFTDGNAGPFDIALGFKPPTGAGLAIDASVVVGGGYLSFDSQKGEYSGVLQLEIADTISVKAIGILTTRMPDGTKGYSFVALIFAQGFAPIQLGLGFALTGIGGLLAINRTFDEEALRGGLKNHMLDSVMFPKDPVRNAPEIISNLNRVFPPASGHHLFGPMVQISWGTPALITANLAVIIEFGERLRLLILAQIAAILPTRENDLIRLQMDAIGILDFDQGTASLDATLNDSRLLKKFVLTGDMAMRLKWKGSPNFALSVGGVHPAFNPPTAFPKLERIAINLSSGDNPRFRCEAYFALTSNSVQFGARAELYVEAAGFSLHGEIGFDVLLQFDPFFFMAGFHAQIQLKRNSTNLFKIRLEGEFSGPRPLHIKGKATFEILWWDVSISIDKTLVEGEKPPPPEPVDVLPRLKEALGNAGNWVSQLPDGQRQVVMLRARTGGPTDVFLHPLGTLTVKQNVVPLNLDISKFGQSTPAGARRFSITSVTVGDQTPTPQPIKEFFAPAQFLDMTDDEKLSRPSFEQMTAGVAIASNEFAFTENANDLLEANSIEFETWILEKNKEKRPSNPPSNPQAPKTFYKLSPTLLERQSRFGAAANSELRRTGNAKYRTSRVAHTLSKEGWSIVATEDLTVQPVAGIAVGQSTNYSQAAQALRQLKQADPDKAAGLKILRLSELSKN